MNRRRKPVVAGRTTTLRPAERPKRGPGWWHRLGKVPKALVATATPLVLAVAIPGVAPLAADRTRDVFSDEVLTAHGESYPSLVAGAYWATDAVLTVPSSYDVFDEMSRHTSAQLGTSGQQVTLESHRSGRIDLEKITAVVEERCTPLAGTAFVADPQGSGEAALIEFRLDAAAGTEIPALVPGDDPGGPTRPYLTDGKVRFVEQGKTEHLVIRAHTEKCFCRWRVRIEYSYRGSRRSLVVPPSGQPAFATTAWGPHDVEYNMHSGETGIGPKRHDCRAQPASCRFKP
ncbi:hypothetical protein ACIRSS_28630 [Amycolatopsis sp. NPDC101161]|uniref:hypothetical protein n=1 Tax=Amycolatopsis sp. NPDC101161 TaxID=3363940 RepID=UPI0038119049